MTQKTRSGTGHGRGARPGTAADPGGTGRTTPADRGAAGPGRRSRPERRGDGPRGRRGLRGWGGSAGMAAACALALAALALPVTLGGAPGGTGPAPGGSMVRTSLEFSPAVPGAEEECDPEASLRPSSGGGDAVARIKKRGKLVAGVDQNSFLWGYRDPASGDFAGFDIALVRAIAEEILDDPAAVTFKTVPTAKRVEALQDHDVDLIARTMTITCKRLNDIAFSTVYFESGQQLLVPKSSPVKAFDDTLRGKEVCTAEGSTGETALDDESHGATVVTVPNQLDCLVRLQLGEVDAVLTDGALAAGQAAQDPTVHLVGEQLAKEPYGIGMNKEDTDLVRRVNKVLEDYRAGGSGSPWVKAYEEWLEDEMGPADGPPPARYRD